MIKTILREIKNTESIILLFVLLQPVLSVLQIVLIDVTGYSEEAANKLRIIGVVATMLPVIVLSFKRNASRYFTWYIPFYFFLLITIIRFPENTDIVISNALKFTVPLVLPTIIVVSNLSSIEKFEKYMYVVSWLQLLIMIFYCILLFSGSILFSDYNMGLSYALLLSTLSLYSHESWISKVAAILMFLIMLALGSRGPLVVGLMYAFIDMIFKNRKYIIWLMLFLFMGSGIIIAFSSFLESIGITSRFLFLLQSDEGVLGHTSGREEIYAYWTDRLFDNFIGGLGLFCDRLPTTPFCHNVLIEVSLNYGVILGSFFILCFLNTIRKTFIKLDADKRMILAKYLLAGVVPLFVSSSYLINANFAVSFGVLLLLRRYPTMSKAIKYHKQPVRKIKKTC